MTHASAVGNHTVPRLAANADTQQHVGVLSTSNESNQTTPEGSAFGLGRVLPKARSKAVFGRGVLLIGSGNCLRPDTKRLR